MSVMTIDTIKCITFAPGPNPPNPNIHWELLVKVDDEPRLLRLEGGVQKGETRPVVDEDALVSFTDRARLTLRQEILGIGSFLELGPVDVNADDLGARVLQFVEPKAHFEIACRVIEGD